MVHQLRNMGFTDMREILGGIRHVSDSAEAAMMWILQQRDETAEARKMDDARARSEQLRREAAQRRAQAAAERLHEASVEEWKQAKDLFHGSVLLNQLKENKVRKIREQNEQVLIDFLQLEKKTRKWYGRDVPWCYWCQIANRWNQTNDQDIAGLVQNIRDERTTLEKSMYSLEEQVGGVPKLFDNARQDASCRGLPTAPPRVCLKRKRDDDDNDNDDDDDDDDDDEVIVLDGPIAKARIDTSKATSEVIEIL